MTLQVDGIEYLKLLTMMVIISSCYYEKSVFQQSNEHDPKQKFSGATPADPQFTLAKRSLPSLSTSRIVSQSFFLCLSGEAPTYLQEIIRWDIY